MRGAASLRHRYAVPLRAHTRQPCVDTRPPAADHARLQHICSSVVPSALALRRDAARALCLASGGEDCRVVVHRFGSGEGEGDGLEGDGEVVCRDRTHSDAVTALAWRTDVPDALLSASRDRTILVHAP